MMLEITNNMKKLFTSLLVLVSLAAFSQRNKIDSVRWKDQQLIQYPGGVQGGLLDSRGNFVLPSNVSTGYRNRLLGYNGNVAGTANTALGNNQEVEGVIGAYAEGADHIIHLGADYSHTEGDANQTWGYASHNGGYGNKLYDSYGVIYGNDNQLGTTPNQFWSSTIIGQQNRAAGNLSLTVGRAVQSTGDNIYTFGTGQDGTLNRLQSNHPGSFNIGFNNKMLFQVFKEGQIVINGVQYNFPTSQGAPGSVLVNDGNGNLSWSAPQMTARAVQPQGFKVYNSAGQLLFVVPANDIR